MFSTTKKETELVFSEHQYFRRLVGEADDSSRQAVGIYCQLLQANSRLQWCRSANHVKNYIYIYILLAALVKALSF
jgi:hypothetical protein